LFQGRPTVIGHRGFGAREVLGYRENTVESLTAAALAGVEWVELDVHRCLDGLAMLHDPVALDGDPVIGRSVDELRACGVDDLASALEALPASVGVDIDLKSSLEDAGAEAEQSTAAVLAPLVEREASRRPLLVTSFDPAALLELKERVATAPVGLLTWFRFPPRIAVAAAARLGMDVVGLQVGSLASTDPVQGGYVLRPDAPQILQAAHAAGMQVLAWCPDEAGTALLAAAGVDAVVVDDAPARLVPQP
jgi:glycerophosphoryl diester phosphodiesterase